MPGDTRVAAANAAAGWGWSATFSTEIKPRVLWSTVLFPGAWEKERRKGLWSLAYTGGGMVCSKTGDSKNCGVRLFWLPRL